MKRFIIELCHWPFFILGWCYALARTAWLAGIMQFGKWIMAQPEKPKKKV